MKMFHYIVSCNLFFCFLKMTLLEEPDTSRALPAARLPLPLVNCRSVFTDPGLLWRRSRSRTEFDPLRVLEMTSASFSPTMLDSNKRGFVNWLPVLPWLSSLQPIGQGRRNRNRNIVRGTRLISVICPPNTSPFWTRLRLSRDLLEAFRDHGTDDSASASTTHVDDATAITTARLAPELPATASAVDRDRRTADRVEADEDLVPPRERRREQQVLKEISHV